MDELNETDGTREETNASLKAERAGPKGAVDPITDTIETRVLDDLIERGRLLADDRLFKFREQADELLAYERLSAPTQDVATTLERRRADNSMRAERQLNDTLLGQERGQADVRTSARRARNDVAKARRRVLRHDTDAKLEAERDESEDALRQRQDRLAMVSHDLRSPLAVITLSAGFLMEDSTDATTREVARDIDRAAARMERLLLDLLDVARIEAGTLHIVKDDHDICALLKETSNSYRALFASRDLTFEVHLPPISLVAAFDHDRIVQVVSNLLGNALKFTAPQGHVSLFARVEADEIELEIRDDGPGVSVDALPHMFERFWQAEDGSRRGLGLGLYICREVVQQHGGRIWVDSTAGKGTSVHFTLPSEAAASMSASA